MIRKGGDYMKIAIRYYSRGGNTRKMAKAVSEAVGVTAYTADKPLTEDVDILFLGSAMYAGGVDGHIKEFINGINVKVGKVVSFSTTAAAKSTYKNIAKLLEVRNIPLAAEEFSCKGSFALMHRGKPDRDDLAALARFAKSIIAE